MSSSNVDLSFTDGELKLLSLFEGEEKAKIAESILMKKCDIMSIRVDKCTTIVTFIKDIALSILNGADKLPAVIDSYNKLKQMDSENESKQQ